MAKGQTAESTRFITRTGRGTHTIMLGNSYLADTTRHLLAWTKSRSAALCFDTGEDAEWVADDICKRRAVLGGRHTSVVGENKAVICLLVVVDNRDD